MAIRVQARSFFPTFRSAMLAGSVLALTMRGTAQQGPPPTVPDPTPVTTTGQAGSATTSTTTSTTTDTSGKTTQNVNSTVTFGRGKKKDKAEKVVQTKETKKELKKERGAEALVGVDSRLPDKALYDKAVVAMNKGHYDVARLDLQTMLNTYPNSEYQMRAKLAVADSWYKEGGTAALTQAESEYADFRVFFPNAPEAAEAQMRIGDIYFRQMDRPDRDYSKTLHAEEEYRRMLMDYPDSPLIPQAKQRLREVQEVLAAREADIASFYGTRANYAAEIARYQTVVDTYPLYSHMDDVLIGLGDAYEAEAKYVRTLKLPEAGKAKMEQTYDSLAADQYRKVVLEHSAAPHVEDAKDRLQAMNLPVPVPTAEQVAASEALENSRSTYHLTDRVRLLIMHVPDSVPVAKVGEPTMVDPKPTIAPTILKKVQTDFASAFAPPAPGGAAAAATAAPSAAAAATTAAPVSDAAPATAAAPAAPLALHDVETGETSGAPAPAANLTASPSAGTASSGVGIDIVSPAATGAPDPNNGLTAVGPKNTAPLPAAEKPEAAPDQVNDVAGVQTAPAQAAPADGSKPKTPAFDKGDESSSKHKPKKGIKKVIPPNPF